MGKHITHHAPAQNKILEFGLEKIIELYGGSLTPMQAIADQIGVSCTVLSRTLAKYPQDLARARAMRAECLLEYGLSQLYAEPDRITDAAGNSRIDPACVSLMIYRTGEAIRQAAILDARLSERRRVAVTPPASPLSDMLAEIARRGSSVPISTVEGECDGLNVVVSD